jgi:hypothetical protein
MSQTVISLNDAAEWTLRADIDKTATSVIENGKEKFFPIPGFNLGLSINSRFIAVAILINYGKPSWTWGGLLNIDFGLPFATSTPGSNGVAASETLLVNKTRIIEANKISGASYGLFYLPPRWFRDVKIKVWQYNGTEYNFVDETLFDIQQKVNQLILPP